MAVSVAKRSPKLNMEQAIYDLQTKIESLEAAKKEENKELSANTILAILGIGFTIVLGFMAMMFNNTNSRFNSVESRFSSIEGRLNSIEGRLSSMDGKIDGLKNLIIQLHGKKR